MQDYFGREIDYVRISVTDRCNLRCVYCMPNEGVKKLAHADILSFEEILRICRVFASLGMNKVKITGGEPLVRRGVTQLVGDIKQLNGIENVTLTTNGVLLGQHVPALVLAGIDAVNVSLDTLDAKQYTALTRKGNVEEVLKGIDVAVKANIPVKVNCVPMSPFDPEHILRIAQLAKYRKISVRFIEMMPMGLGKNFSRIDNNSIKQLLEKEIGIMKPCAKQLGNGPAKYYSLDNFQGNIGFISAMGDCFCNSCNRIRLTAEGCIKSCLHMDKGIGLRPALRQPDDMQLKHCIVDAIQNKPERHCFAGNMDAQDGRMMSQIGG